MKYMSFKRNEFLLKRLYLQAIICKSLHEHIIITFDRNPIYAHWIPHKFIFLLIVCTEHNFEHAKNCLCVKSKAKLPCQGCWFWWWWWWWINFISMYGCTNWIELNWKCFYVEKENKKEGDFSLSRWFFLSPQMPL
jgi:hypothetical protein